MIRLLGILAGAALAVAALILLVGLPEFPDKPVQDVPATAVHADAPAITDATPPDSVIEDLPELPGAQVPSGFEELAEIPDIEVDTIEQQPESNHWYAFWSPFRSEIAANGFVSQLQRTTGLDYRVVKLKPGVYEVAFAYSDDADVENKLAQISAATGLDIPEG